MIPNILFALLCLTAIIEFDHLTQPKDQQQYLFEGYEYLPTTTTDDTTDPFKHYLMLRQYDRCLDLLQKEATVPTEQDLKLLKILKQQETDLKQQQESKMLYDFSYHVLVDHGIIIPNSAAKRTGTNIGFPDDPQDVADNQALIEAIKGNNQSTTLKIIQKNLLAAHLPNSDEKLPIEIAIAHTRANIVTILFAHGVTPTEKQLQYALSITPDFNKKEVHQRMIQNIRNKLQQTNLSK